MHRHKLMKWMEVEAETWCESYLRVFPETEDFSICGKQDSSTLNIRKDLTPKLVHLLIFCGGRVV